MTLHTHSHTHLHIHTYINAYTNTCIEIRRLERFAHSRRKRQSTPTNKRGRGCKLLYTDGLYRH